MLNIQGNQRILKTINNVQLINISGEKLHGASQICQNGPKMLPKIFRDKDLRFDMTHKP